MPTRQKEFVMHKGFSGFDMQHHLIEAEKPLPFITGVVFADKSVLAFGRMIDGEKVRYGSISYHGEPEMPGSHWTVLSYPDSAHEFRADTKEEVHDFLLMLSATGLDWPAAEDFMRLPA